MQPLIYSEKAASLASVGWVRCGQNIRCPTRIIFSDLFTEYTFTSTNKFNSEFKDIRVQYNTLLIFFILCV